MYQYWLLLILITPAKEFYHCTGKKGLNPKVAFILLLSLQMIPEMTKQSNVIMNSQKARGVETEGNILVRAKALIQVFYTVGTVFNSQYWRKSYHAGS